MKNEGNQKKQTQDQKKPITFWIGIGAAVVILILAVALVIRNAGEDENTDWAPVIPGETTLHSTADEENPTGETDPINSEQDSSPVDSHIETESTDSQSTDSQSSNTEGQTIPTLGDEDPYEDWLASAMIIGISMQYSDYEFLGIYTASETPLSAHDSSAGAYVVFTGDGEALALKSVPLEGERQEKGTKDLYVPALGYATFDLVPTDSIPIASLKERKLEDLEALIIASTQVSIIEKP